MRSVQLLIVLLSSLLALAVGCPGAPDDDVVSDDAYTPPTDDDDLDDDDDLGDDDDDVICPGGGAMTHGATLTFAPPAGDDDDSAGDDDDSADDDDDSAGAPLVVQSVTIVYDLTYWADQAAGVANCVQFIEASGEAMLGPGSLDAVGCAACEGLILLDPSSVVDISDRTTDPEHCDPTLLDAAQSNYGAAFTRLPPDGGGDFLSLALMTAEVMEELELSFHVNGSQTAAEIASELAVDGFELVRVGSIDLAPATIAAQGGLAAIANPAEDGSSWYFYWYLYRDPATNAHEGPGLQGQYLAGSFWQFGGVL